MRRRCHTQPYTGDRVLATQTPGDQGADQDGAHDDDGPQQGVVRDRGHRFPFRYPGALMVPRLVPTEAIRFPYLARTLRATVL